MKGILGRKLGMTQIFDPETGNVDAVTVIEAGPCPVVLVRTADADGYDAVQLAFEPVAARKLTKGELGDLAKAGASAHRHLLGAVGVPVEAGLADQQPQPAAELLAADADPLAGAPDTALDDVVHVQVVADRRDGFPGGSAPGSGRAG